VLRSFFERQPRARKRPNVTSSSLKAQDLGRFCGCLDGVILAARDPGFDAADLYNAGREGNGDRSPPGGS
jgi:hypothetical protein